jgi:adenine-specific DNA-methyltransferase
VSLPQGFIRRLGKLDRASSRPSAKEAALRLVTRLAEVYSPSKVARKRFKSSYIAEFSTLADWILERPFEEAAYYVSCVYAALTDVESRRRNALYFTPPQLANHILATAISSTGDVTSSVKILDPACGGAAFLLPAVRLIRDQLIREQAGPRLIVKVIRSNVRGMERDPVLAHLCRRFMEITLAKELASAGGDLRGTVTVGNTLSRAAVRRLTPADVVLCNPPYRKVTGLEFPIFKRRYADLIAGQPNIYTFFMKTAIDLTRAGGTVALLTPTSYMTGETYEPIRRELLLRTEISKLHFVHERGGLFLGVEHDVVALFAKKMAHVSANRIAVSTWVGRKTATPVGSFELPSGGEPWHLPRDRRARVAMFDARDHSHTLESYGYRVRIGSYVWNRDTRQTFREPPTADCKWRVVPVIWAPYITQGGTFRFEAPSDRERNARFIRVQTEHEVGLVTRECVLLQRTSSRNQQKRLVAAAIPKAFIARYGSVVAENHVIVIEPIHSRPLVTPRQLAALLNHADIAALYSTTSGTSAVSAYNLRKLPLPDPPHRGKVRPKHNMTIGRQTSLRTERPVISVAEVLA